MCSPDLCPLCFLDPEDYETKPHNTRKTDTTIIFTVMKLNWYLNMALQFYDISLVHYTVPSTYTHTLYVVLYYHIMQFLLS